MLPRNRSSLMPLAVWIWLAALLLAFVMAHLLRSMKIAYRFDFLLMDSHGMTQYAIRMTMTTKAIQSMMCRKSPTSSLRCASQESCRLQLKPFTE